MRILGIDPGTRLCGYGAVDTAPPARPTYVECGVLQLGGDGPLPRRLRQLAADLREVINDLQPEAMALESIFHGINAQSALRLGYARGVIMLLCEEAGLPLFEYPPATVKRTVAGTGRATKDEVGRMVRWTCQLRSTPQVDAADALAVALCHAYHAQAPTAKSPPRPYVRGKRRPRVQR